MAKYSRSNLHRIRSASISQQAYRLHALGGAIDSSKVTRAGTACRELDAVLTADYREASGLPSPEMARHLAELAKTGIDPRRQEWRRWERAANFRIKPRVFDSNEVAVYAAPYTKGAGLSLWGFSCDARKGDEGVFVIFLNTAHQRGAVAATVAHELGHYIDSSLAPRNSRERNEPSPMAPNFAAHLDDARELFSDSLVALSAFDRAAVRDPLDCQAGLAETVSRAHRTIHPEYRIDFDARRLGRLWRLRYVAATVHFFKLRRALLETAGI